MNSVGARELVNRATKGFITAAAAQFPGSRAATTCSPISRLRSINGHSGALAAAEALHRLFRVRSVVVTSEGEALSASDPGIADADLEVLFLLAAEPPRKRLDRDSFLLACAPAVNLFRQEARSQYDDHTRSELLIEPETPSEQDCRIFSIDEVRCLREELGSDGLAQRRPLNELFTVILDLALEGVNAERGVLMLTCVVITPAPPHSPEHTSTPPAAPSASPTA